MELITGDELLTEMVIVPQLPAPSHPPSERTKYVVFCIGLTVIDDPVPIDVSPQPPIYHFQSVALLRLPLLILNKVLFPVQILLALASIAGAVDPFV